MSETTLSIQLLLNDQDALRQLQAGLDKVNTQSQTATNSMNLGWAGFASQLYIVQQIFGPVLDVIKQAITLSEQQEQTIKRLNIALQMQGFTTGTVSKEYQEMAQSLALSTNFTRQEIEAAITTLVNLGNVGPDQIQKVLTATLNLATITGHDLPEASLKMSKAMEGDLSTFRRWGIILDMSKSSAEQLNQLMGILSGKFSGAAQKDVETFAGTQTQLKKAVDEVLEGLGNFVINSTGIQAAMKSMTKGANEFADSLKRINTESESDSLKKFAGANKQNADIARLFQQQNASALAAGGEAENDAAMPSSEENFLRSLVNAHKDANDQIESMARAHTTAMENIDKLMNDSRVKSTIDSTNLFKQQKDEETLAVLMADKKQLDDFLKTQKLTQAERKKYANDELLIEAALTKAHQEQSKAILQAELEKYKSQLEMAQSLASLSGALATATGSSALAGMKIVLEATVAMVKAIIAMKAIANPWEAIKAGADIALVVVTAANAFAQMNAAQNALKASQNQSIQAVTNVPGLASGGNIFTGGLTLVGEKGPELLNLPSGSTVMPLGGGGPVYNINIVINNPIFPPERLVSDLVKMLGPELSAWMDNERRRL